MTGQGMGAIATVQLFGESAEEVLQRVFRARGGRALVPGEGRIALGSIVEDGKILDEVTLGCEGPHTFALHCHGNPLIVARIMELLRRQAVQVVPAEQLLARVWASRKPGDAVGMEARLALATVKTLEGAAILANQVQGGLSEKIRGWQDRFDSLSLEEIAIEARDILQRSEPARLMISGCAIALVGPPNTGKSTLLNTLAGREKAIVSDLGGTTRDWVSAEIHIPPLAATIIDTAGLAPRLTSGSEIDQAACHKSLEIIDRANLILLVLDLSRSAVPLAEELLNRLPHGQTLAVLNKADLPPRFDPADLPPQLGQTVRISAKQGTGLDDLIRAIHHVCGVADFKPRTPVAFTDRQRRLLQSLPRSDTKAQARRILSDLLESPVALSEF
jgi:tRNA modification GTPase